VPKPLTAAQWAVLADADDALPESPTPYAPAGCIDCRRTGYLGRVGLYELLPLGSRLRALIRADMDLAGFSRAARAEGLRTLRRAGLEKVAAGLTTIEEVLSVLPPVDEPHALPDS
jgi:general secretion pathway protein E